MYFGMDECSHVRRKRGFECVLEKQTNLFVNTTTNVHNRLLWLELSLYSENFFKKYARLRSADRRRNRKHWLWILPENARKCYRASMKLSDRCRNGIPWTQTSKENSTTCWIRDCASTESSWKLVKIQRLLSPITSVELLRPFRDTWLADCRELLLQLPFTCHGRVREIPCNR